MGTETVKSKSSFNVMILMEDKSPEWGRKQYMIW